MDKEDRTEIKDTTFEKLNLKIHNSKIKNEYTVTRYKLYQLMNVTYKCNNTLLTSFGLFGKFNMYAKRNKRPIYCISNGFTCCSDNQFRTAMESFGKSLVNLRKDIEPVIEVVLALKTKSFVNTFANVITNPACSNIFQRAFNKDPMSPEFNIKKSINQFIK